MVTAIQIDRNDNVAMVTAPVKAEQEICITETGVKIKVLETIDAGHKVALTGLRAGEIVIKYGIPIGRMLSDVDVGGMVSVHNLEDITEDLCGEYCRRFKDDVIKVKNYPPKNSNNEKRMIRAYPRADGSFGIRNYIMVISTRPECNNVAEMISNKTGCAWFVCDRTRMEEGNLTEYTRKAMIYTGLNPNVYAALVVGTDSDKHNSERIYTEIAVSGKPIERISLGNREEQRVLSEGISIIEGYQREVLKMKRELVSMDGFGLTVHCSGSDWTTAINGNSSLGAAADIVVKNGGRVFMTEWMEWSGSQHLMAEKCATRELGLDLLDTVDEVRATVLRETGLPVEYMNPTMGQKIKGALTTLVEKSTGTIRKVGNSQIQGLLDYCEKPTGEGVWLPKHASVWPPTSAIYGALSGAHMSVHVSGLGNIYYELPHMICVRMTGNPETYNNKDFKFDFNAGIAFDGKTIPEVGEALFEYLIRIAEGDDNPNTEPDKVRAFNMYYYTENEFGTGIDRSRILYCNVQDYHEKYNQYTNNVK